MDNCPFTIEVHTECKPTREFNALDGMFFGGSPIYRWLCSLLDKPIIPPSELLKEIETIRGKYITFTLDEVEYHAQLDFTDDYQIIFKDSQEVY